MAPTMPISVVTVDLYVRVDHTILANDVQMRALGVVFCTNTRRQLPILEHQQLWKKMHPDSSISGHIKEVCRVLMDLLNPQRLLEKW